MWESLVWFVNMKTRRKVRLFKSTIPFPRIYQEKQNGQARTEQGGLVVHWFADGTVGNPVEALRGWTAGGRRSLGASLEVCSLVSLSVLFLLLAPWRCVQVALLSCFHRHGLLLHLSSHCTPTLSTASQSEYFFA